MSYTPGPWHLEISNYPGSDRQFIVADDGRTGDPIAVINDMNKHNLSLILASPDLLEALKLAFSLIHGLDIGSAPMVKISNAIGKAEGRVTT